MTDQSRDNYAFWQAALEGVEIGGPLLPLHADAPQCGFFRMKRGGHYVPVAIFDDEGKRVALVEREQHEAANVWLRCCTQPVTETAYRLALDSGTWADVHPTVALALATAMPEREKLARLLAEMSREAAALGEQGVASDIAAEQAQSLRARILELVKEADTKREVEKRPHLEAGRAVDSAWKVIIGGGREAAGIVASAVGAYLTKRAAEQKANTPEPIVVRGGYGRAASVRDVVEVERVIDWAALFQYYATDMRAQDCIVELARRDLARGVTVPHIETKTRKALR